MVKALVTLGSQTSHGGVVSECENTFTINGIDEAFLSKMQCDDRCNCIQSNYGG